MDDDKLSERRDRVVELAFEHVDRVLSDPDSATPDQIRIVPEMAKIVLVYY